jgi:NAD(P)-dependent dehydrogenase (short-subunit alcohol dehydrogenase family)
MQRRAAGQQYRQITVAGREMRAVSVSDQEVDWTEDLFDLSERRALVTGASRGIGRAIALGLAARGAAVCVVARSQDGLDQTVSMAEGMPGVVHAVAADLRSQASIQRTVESTVASIGGLDILVNNAADDTEGPIEQLELSTWQRVLELNLQSCYLLCQAASPHLRKGGHGKVINVASILGHVAMADGLAYTAAKHGLIGLTRALGVEWATQGIQVNALSPGWIETEMTAQMTADEEASAAITSRTPMGRWGRTQDLIGPAIFLASSASDFMTGQSLVVDGGWVAV